MLITNGIIVNAGGTQKADLRIDDELIVEIDTALAVQNPSEQVIDAQGMLVLPGGVDPHTHMDLQMGAHRATDDFFTGTVAAACGGTTTIIDHIGFGPAGCSLQHQIDAYHGLAGGKAVIDYGFHCAIARVDDAILKEMSQLPDLGVTSLKFYMTYANRLSDEETVNLLARSRELGILCCVHCEDHAMLTELRKRFVAEGKTEPLYHALSRPAECEAQAVSTVLNQARAAGDAPVYIVHLSSAAGLAATQDLPFIPNVILETCPQYLLLDDSLYAQANNEGLKYIMSPPLRKRADAVALWQGLADGRIDTIGTDHCPFYFATDKQAGKDDFTQCPNGMPGVELRLSLIHSEGVVKRGLGLERFVELCCAAPAQRFGLYPKKGVLAVGSDADVVIFDPDKEVTITHDLLHERVDYTPYEGMRITGYPRTTISRGEIIVQDGRFNATKGRGRFLKRGFSRR
ncbi:MAG: dihydropyrimidinase [Coriobacteriia bacterium]|nr:dihydropyrimidinase [Coriobacteriia bacterium]